MTAADRIKDRKIGIVGMAKSGIAAAILAEHLGGKPFVSDSSPESDLGPAIHKLKSVQIPFETNGNSDRLLDSDYLIVSPGVPLTVPILKKATERGIPIFAEIEFASWVCRGEIVAVTGSNGKTTTVTLIGEMLTAAGLNAYVCGNVGRPFSEVALEIDEDAIAVVEVSTFQLETIEDFKPNVALILNLSPDHLDRHGDFETYKKLKYRIAENQTADDLLLLNMEDQHLTVDTIKTSATRAYFSSQDQSAMASVQNGSLTLARQGQSEKVLRVDEILIPGPHNLQNSAAAVATVGRFRVPVEIMSEVLKRFTGVEHRMERVGKITGIEFINDSKATNVDSVCYALRSIDTPIYLIAGGKDKGASYAPMIEFGLGKIKGIIAIGEAKEKIFTELGKAFPIHMAETLEDAVSIAFEMAHPGDTVMLSPACASFDMFNNFEHRGRTFKTAIAKLKNNKNSDETISS